MLILITLLYSTTIAQAEPFELSPIEVVPRAAVDPVSLNSGEGTYIRGEDWEAGGERIENVLPAIPGVAFSAAGGPGQTRSLFLRGAKAEHTLVLIDGMPVNDPLSPARGFDFGQIPVGDIEAIEVLKGPQSVLYGGDALGGVIKIFTRQADARPRLFFEAGSFATLRLRASAKGLAAGFTRSRGFSSADQRQGNFEPDGHLAGNISLNQAYPLGPRRTLRATAFYNYAKTDTDRAGGPGGDSFGTFTKNSQAAARPPGRYPFWRGYRRPLLAACGGGL
ncbi:MAG: TonB-dependent receptor, partial [Proteobacteria bacterium]